MIVRIIGYVIAIVAGLIVTRMLMVVLQMHLHMNSIGMRGSFWRRLSRQPLHLLAIWVFIGAIGVALILWSDS